MYDFINECFDVISEKIISRSAIKMIIKNKTDSDQSTLTMDTKCKMNMKYRLAVTLPDLSTYVKRVFIRISPIRGVCW